MTLTVFCIKHRAEVQRKYPGKYRWVQAPHGLLCVWRECQFAADAKGELVQVEKLDIDQRLLNAYADRRFIMQWMKNHPRAVLLADLMDATGIDSPRLSWLLQDMKHKGLVENVGGRRWVLVTVKQAG